MSGITRTREKAKDGPHYSKGVILTADALFALVLCAGLLVLVLAHVSAPRVMPSTLPTELFVSDLTRLASTGLNESDARLAFTAAGMCGSVQSSDENGAGGFGFEACACKNPLKQVVPVFDQASGTGRIMRVSACQRGG